MVQGGLHDGGHGSAGDRRRPQGAWTLQALRDTYHTPAVTTVSRGSVSMLEEAVSVYTSVEVRESVFHVSYEVQAQDPRFLGPPVRSRPDAYTSC